VWNLPGFGVSDLETCAKALRDLQHGASSMEEVGGRLVSCLYEGLRDGRGERAVVLARLYKTHPFRGLDPDLQRFAEHTAGGPVAPTTPCLTLLATVGDRPEWCDRRASALHRAIPLTSPEAVANLPMVSKLFDDLGIEIGEVLRGPVEDDLARHHRNYNVFYVPEAAASPWVPAKAFVSDHGIRSVVGMGGVLPSGEMFALMLFTRVHVPPQVADLFRSLSMAVKAAVVPFTFTTFDRVTSNH
jgi:hypothetical protein